MLTVDQTTLRLEVEVRVEADYDFLSDEYRAFYGPDRATAFQAPLWMHMLHRQLAPKLNAKQHTLTVRNRGDGGLLALIPLVLQRAGGVKILQPADFGVCDYNCVIGDRVTLEQIVQDVRLLGRIDLLTANCDILMFRKVRDDGFDVGRLLRRAKSTPSENDAYHSDTGDDFDEWRRRTIRRKFSKELGRLQRQTERDFGSYEHRAAIAEEDIRSAFDFLRTARAGRFRDDLFANPDYFEFYRGYAIKAAATGEAVTYVSYVAGEPIAVLFGLTGDGDFHAVLIGSDTERFGKNSPGTQIIYQVIKQRFERGYRRFDMGLGNTGYKSHFRVEETHLHNLTRARSPAGSAVALIYNHAKPVKNFLRKFVSNVR